MKTALSLFFILTAALSIRGALQEATKPSTSPPIPATLGFHIVADFDYHSFESCLRQLEKMAGCQVECPADISPLMQTTDRDPAPYLLLAAKYPMPVTRSLTLACTDLGLIWTYHPETGSITLDVPWRRSDPRSAVELLQYVLKQGHDSGIEKNRAWQEAFNALLSKDGNLTKAGRVCQEAVADRIVFQLTDGSDTQPLEAPAWNLLLRAPVVDVSGHQFTLLAFHQLSIASPMSGRVSYFWFREDGTLAGAGLLSSGARCNLTGGAVQPGATKGLHEQPSDVQLEISNMKAHFLLQDDGLKFIRLNDVLGDELNNHYSIGENLLPPPKPAVAQEKTSTGPETYTLEFPKEADTQGLTVVAYLTHRILPGDALTGWASYRPREKVSDGRCTIETRNAASLRAVVFSPRYRPALIDLHFSGKDPGASMAVELKPVPTLRFAGKIDFPEGADPVQYTLEAVYHGHWVARYLSPFGLSDPSFTAASIDLQADGSFASTVPDMLTDPAMGERAEECAFTLILRDKKTGHVPFNLQVDGPAGSDVPIAGKYETLKIRALDWAHP